MIARRYQLLKKCIVAITVAFTSLTAGSASATGIDTSLSNALQSSIESLRTMYSVKGISAAAYIPGKGIWKGVTGISHDAVAIDTGMLFDIGSITKTFVAAGIMKLVQAGDLSLDDTVGALLPPMVNVNTGIKVRQLLSHTSGMGEYLTPGWNSAMFADPGATWYYPVALETFCPVPVGPPGSPWQYCNSNYALLGMIIEAKTGDSLHRVLRNDFLEPLHLANTHMEVFESYPNVVPHNWSTPTLVPSLATDVSGIPRQALCSSTEGPGGLFADPADLVQWGYNLYSGNVLSPSSLAQMIDFLPLSAGYFNGYGLGAMRFQANGRTYYGHGGNFFGFASSMLYYPHDSLCVAVLINQDCIATYEARSLMNTLITKLATLGVKQSSLVKEVSLLPNPANTDMVLTLPQGGVATAITVSDIAGRILSQVETRAGAITIHTADYPEGGYLVKITRSGESVTRQLTIHH